MKSFDQIINDMQAHGMKVPSSRVQLNVTDAANILKATMSYFLSRENNKLEWLKEYDEVAEWLSNNNGRGLFLFGNCGLGKTLLSRLVIPAILLSECGKVVSCYDAQEMNTKLDEVLKKHIISLDDIGTEDVSVTFGNKRLAFAEVIDAAEKAGKLVIVSTNLSKEKLIERYGQRVYDRVISTTTRIALNGQSLRK